MLQPLQRATRTDERDQVLTSGSLADTRAFSKIFYSKQEEQSMCLLKHIHYKTVLAGSPKVKMVQQTQIKQSSQKKRLCDSSLPSIIKLPNSYSIPFIPKKQDDTFFLIYYFWFF